MTESGLGIVAVSCLIVLVLVRVPISVALLLTGFVGSVVLQGWEPSIVQLQLVIWELVGSFVLITLPLFIWMGQLAHGAKLGEDLYLCLDKWLGRFPGGLAIAAIFSSAGFGAVTGSSVATVAAVGKSLLPELKRFGYSPAVASGSLASAGVLAILIPPSVPLVFYSAWTETSLGDLFLAGIVPGVLLTFLFAGYVFVHCWLAGSGAKVEITHSWRERLLSLQKLLPIISIMVIVMGSIYSGIASPTEAAAVGVLSVLIIALLSRRLTIEVVKTSIEQSALLSTNILLLLLSGLYFSRFLVQTGINEQLVNAIVALNWPPIALLLALVLMYLLLGAVLDTFGLIILTLPFVFPVVIAMGFDAVWFGVFIVMMIELALITPPIGINVFVLHRLDPNNSLRTIYKGTLPFVLLSLLLVVILILFPEMAMWLPSLYRLG
ncbi:MAG: TRAP transporter large permease [Pseudomonadales bacterium]|nr:TRAP transporter large permease [Pseudomonadales bacterium]